MGSWKTMETRFPRIRRISFSESWRRSIPSRRTRPPTTRPGGETSRRFESAVTDFPEPDSPTRPRVRPRPIEKLTPSTAFTTPSSVKKWVWRSWTSIRVSAEPRIARLLEGVADQVVDEDGHEDAEPGEEDQPPVREAALEAIVQ